MKMNDKQYSLVKCIRILIRTDEELTEAFENLCSGNQSGSMRIAQISLDVAKLISEGD